MRIEAELHKNETASAYFTTKLWQRNRRLLTFQRSKRGMGHKTILGINADGEGVPDDMSHNQWDGTVHFFDFDSCSWSDSRRNMQHEFAQRVIKTAAQSYYAMRWSFSSSASCNRDNKPSTSQQRGGAGDQSKINGTAPQNAKRSASLS
jgi:hypothetical protein